MSTQKDTEIETGVPPIIVPTISLLETDNNNDMSTQKDTEIETGVPPEQATAPSASQENKSLKKGPLFGLLFLASLLGVAGTVVGSIALKKANDVDSDLDQVSKEICREETKLVRSMKLTPIGLPSSSLSFVPAWDYADLSWFEGAGNRFIYHKHPLFLETDDFLTAEPFGTLSGVCTVTAPGFTHCFLTAEFDDMSGAATFGGINEFAGNTYINGLFGGTKDWQDFVGFVEAQFDPATGIFSAKLYQTCSNQ